MRIRIAAFHSFCVWLDSRLSTQKYVSIIITVCECVCVCVQKSKMKNAKWILNYVQMTFDKFQKIVEFACKKK